MSKVSTVSDAIVARLAAVLPSHVRLPNAYDVPANPETYLKQAYGVKIGPGDNTNRLLGNNVSVRRQFTIVITRKAYALDTDPGGRLTAEKTLLEDQWLMIADIVKDSTLNGAEVASSYLGDTGINQVFSNKNQYLVTEINISAEYFAQP